MHLYIDFICILAESRFKCDLCGKAFVTQVALNKHRKKTHQGTKEFMCQLCDRTFNTQSSLTRHFVTHTTYKPHRCKLCDSHFQEEQELDFHMAQMHADSQAPTQTADDGGLPQSDFVWFFAAAERID